MPIYRNIRTGAIVEVKSKVEGEWELVLPPSDKTVEKPVNKTVKKTKKEV